jgi:alcohol dehydrogenase (cytochrome c)
MQRRATHRPYSAMILVWLAAGVAIAFIVVQIASAQVTPSYSEAQAAQGKAVYEGKCASCHGARLDDGEFAPPLRGDEFLGRWGGKRVDELTNYVSDRMPPNQPGSLSVEQALNAVVYVLSRNAVPPGGQAMNAESQKTMTIPGGGTSLSVMATGLKLPPNPQPYANPLDRLTPVTEQMLLSPPDGEWLHHGRTNDGQGFSPLKQINRSNVAKLRTAWSVALPPGANEAVPLMHGGVLFVLAYKDIVQALDARSGNLLWQYSYRLPKDVNPTFKKSLAIRGELLFMPTSNAHLVALNIKTGAVVWDKAVAETGHTILGGPMVAKGKVIVGTKGPKPVIVALDAATGREAWRFSTIAKPGEPGGDSWNGVPYDKRSGGTIWTAGTYDPATNLVFFGPAPTYDTAPLKVKIAGGDNAALYTNETLALDPDTGRLVWHFGHLPNDQWDLDWAFERVVFTLGKGASARRAVVTAGKEGVHDIVGLDGKYISSIDLGLQNVITAIDPKTGAKTIDPRLVPGDGQVKLVCPTGSGGKNFTPSGMNPNTHLMFVPYAEVCMDLVPVRPGERGLLTTGVRMAIRPQPGSDGLYGRLQAINLETGRTAWTVRERTPVMTGTLATAGGLVFAGSMDRSFSAYDDMTGKKLWTTRLHDVPNSNPISYELDGRQYIAIVVGSGGYHTTDYTNLFPELKNPTSRAAAIWVFEVARP